MDKCAWRHLGGAVLTRCEPQGVVVIGYHYGKPTEIYLKLFKFMQQFKYCPFCGKSIELPKWMTDGSF